MVVRNTAIFEHSLFLDFCILTLLCSSPAALSLPRLILLIPLFTVSVFLSVTGFGKPGLEIKGLASTSYSMTFQLSGLGEVTVLSCIQL